MAKKKVGIEIVVDTNGAVTSLDRVGTSGKKVGKDIEKSFTKSKESVVKFDNSINLATISIAGMAAGVTALTSKFVGLGLESFKNAERVETQFKTLLGSAEAAKERYAELAQFAATTPFNLSQVANASKILETLTKGTLSTGQGLRTVGDAAAIAGVRFDELAVTVGRAYSGLQANRPIGESVSRLQELGLVSGETRNKIEELQKAGKGREAWDILNEALAETKGGMEELSKTLEGKTSTLVDNLGLLSSKFLETSGFVDLLKGKIDFLTESISKQLEEQSLLEAQQTESNKRTKEQQILILKETDKRIQRQDLILKGLEDELEAQENLSNIAKTDLYGTRQRNLNTEAIKRNVELKKEEINLLKQEKQEQIKVLAEINKRKKSEGTEGGTEETDEQKKRKKAILELNEALRQYNNEKTVQIELLRTEQDVQVESDIIEQEKKQIEDSIELQKKKREEEKRIEEEALRSIDNFRRKRLQQEDLEKRIERNKREEYIKTADAGIAAGRELFGANKAFTLAEIVLNTARGVTSALSLVPPNPILAGFIGATGAAQFAKASSQKYADGGFVEGSGTGRSDSISAQLSNGEFVVNARDTARNRDALENINNGGSVTPNINITVNAGVGTDGTEVAQLIVNELSRAQTLGLEPSII